ncbi:hypothetical protein P12x_001930 [Tundrisphaera lichenicola]|uniref:hypothetical protein n=1 Tax=Tundrisphaera lichenicola TaxID=2029860 RepID=UPI003EBA7875
MNHLGRLVLPILAAVVGVGAAEDPIEPKQPSAGPRFDMSKGVVVSRVNGLDDFVELAEPRLTSEDKLKVYFRPLNYKVEPFKKRYRASFTEDGRIRRKGEKNPIAKEDKLLEYEDVFDDPTYRIYLVNTIGLKSLPPGDYEFDITLHDVLDEGSSARQSIPFTIVPTPQAVPSTDEAGSGESTEAPAPASKKTSKARKKPARPRR